MSVSRYLALLMAMLSLFLSLFGYVKSNVPEAGTTVPVSESLPDSTAPETSAPSATEPETTLPPDTEPPTTEPPAEEPQPGTPEWEQKKAVEIQNTMSLDEKIGQLFCIAPSSLKQAGTAYSETAWSGSMTAMLKRYPAGGIILFASNIANPEQITAYTAAMQKASDIPLFICVDEEGGRVARIAKNTNFSVPTYESMGAVGASGDTAQAYNAGKTIGGYLKEYGFTTDFAPVADVNTNPENIVIGNRAFGSAPTAVSGMVSAAVDGFHDAGIMTSLKHFPGHGDTKGDTHTGYVSVSKTWEDLKQCELIPFIGSMDKTDMIMVAHITLPNITADGLPASLSKELITEKLRGELGYDGIVITDALNMGAISQNYTAAESARKAFEAGCDILLMPGNYTEAFESIRTAVQNGAISEQRLNESVQRILRLKLHYGLIAES